jgi:hypothetical protein
LKFVGCGATDFDFFIEVYYSGNQCNFEIFNSELLGRLSKILPNVSVPVSVYQIKKKQIKDLLLSNKME